MNSNTAKTALALKLTQGLPAFGALLLMQPAPSQALTTPGHLRAAASETAEPSGGPSSLAAHLQLKEAQLQSLDRLYDSYAALRAGHNEKMARWQSQLRRAQAPSSFNEREASRLTREMSAAQQKLSADFLWARSRALRVLTPVQRAQLEALAGDSRIAARPDKYLQLLVLPEEEFESLGPSQLLPPSQHTTRGASRRSKGTARYGVYGGYSYGGPNYGVYGSYGHGPVGVHVGIGRGGPSIGIGIGGRIGR
jgi:Spy/CpxP family protein refolding chaperone